MTDGRWSLQKIMSDVPEGQVPLVQVSGLRKLYPLTAGLFQTSRSYIHAVDDISFTIPHGESLGLVGESGSGKTTTGKLLVRLIDPTEGQIHIYTSAGDTEIAHLRGRELKKFRRHVQMIFQDPYESLNPRRTIFDTIAEPLVVQGIGDLAERERRVAELLVWVGLIPPETFMFRYPHELSGGQCQRVAVARALALNPRLIVLDEPTSSLDVSVQAQIINLIEELRQAHGLTYLFISHDLNVVQQISARIGVMYLGKLVELGPCDTVFLDPLHPYTQALFGAIPLPEVDSERKLVILEGNVPSPIAPPSGCRFHPRCRLAQSVCSEVDPDFLPLRSNRMVACHLVKP